MSITLDLNRSRDGTPNRIFVESTFEQKDLVKLAGSGTASWRKTERVWSVPVDPTLVRRFLKYFPTATLSEDLRLYLRGIKETQERINEVVKDYSPIDGKTDLWPFQNASVRFLVERGRAVLAHQMALGKTVITCRALDTVPSDRVLIVCLNLLKWSWAKHLVQWADSQRPMILTSGTVLRNEKPTKQFGEIKEFQGNGDQRKDYLLSLQNANRYCIVMNYAQMRIHHKSLSKLDFDVVIFDEAHRLNNGQTKQYRAAKTITKSSPYLWLLTGTPMRNDYSDYYGPLSLIDPIRFSGYWNFVNTYLETIPHQYKHAEIVGLKDPPIFNRMLSSYMFRKTKPEVLEDLPEKVYNDIPVPMTAEQYSIYARMLYEFKAYVEENGEDKVLHAEETIARITRLRQIALTPALIGAENTSGKLEALKELLEEYPNEPFIIFTAYREFIPHIEEVLDQIGITHGRIVGGMPADELRTAEDRLGTEVQCIVGTIAAMGEGLNLQRGTSAIFTDIYWTPAVNRQAEERIHRPGIEKSPTIVRLYHPGTVDETIRRICWMKERMEDDTLGKIEEVRELVRDLT